MKWLIKVSGEGGFNEKERWEKGQKVRCKINKHTKRINGRVELT